MSFKTKKVNNKEKELEIQTKEKQNLVNLIESIENSSLPFALIKLSVNIL